MGRTRAAIGRSSIYKDADGIWRGWATVGTKPDGSPDRRHRRAKTQAEVTEKIRSSSESVDGLSARLPGDIDRRATG